MLLSRQAGGDSAATLYPLSLAPSPPPSLLPPLPSSRASLPLHLASPPLHPLSHTPEALEQSRPTLGNRYSHHHSLFLSASISLSLAQCLHGQHALLINGGQGFQRGEEDTSKGRLGRQKRRKRRRVCNIVCPCSPGPQHHFFFMVLPFPLSPIRFLIFYRSITLFTHKGQFKRVEYF